jgi:signal transduction histidine kinase
MQRPRRSIVVYSITAVAIAAATAIRFALSEVLGEHLMFSMYYLAVSVAAWAGGIRPAMITAILSSILASYIFTDPRGQLVASNWEELIGLIIFLSVSLVIGVLAEISLNSSERVRAAEQQKDDFLAILAHELRNPLAIIHYTNVAEQQAPLGANDGRSGVIDRQVQQLDQMIDDLLDISRVSRGKFRLEFEPIGVASIVDEVLEEVEHIIDDRDHELTVTRADDELIVWGDPLRLEQIVSNLLRNAARYTPRGGRIELNVFAENDSLVLRIRDNGQGIPKEMLSRVFDLHTQVQRSLETSGTGLGVGLALVRTLVELHGGKIAALSEGPNRGSEFIIRIPLYKPQQSMVDTKAAREAS